MWARLDVNRERRLGREDTNLAAVHFEAVLPYRVAAIGSPEEDEPCAIGAQRVVAVLGCGHGRPGTAP
jgi:hypothetical protein